ncbi:Uncharacterised protein [Serratia liquefaciens]|nr:Uncharacterised protein [Serratia liquefaciens]
MPKGIPEFTLLFGATFLSNKDELRYFPLRKQQKFISVDQSEK